MTALLLVDIQNDFLPGGALAVPEGNQILPVVNRLIEKKFDLIVASKDWHPANHKSFASSHHRQPGEQILLNGLPQILWPDHCVQETSGAEFSLLWDSSRVNKIFHKGTDVSIDSYSAFFDNNHQKSTGLAEYLQNNKIHELYVVGLATDYCVKYTVLDALKLGFKVFVVSDACKGVNLHPDDSHKALDLMQQVGATIIHSTAL